MDYRQMTSPCGLDCSNCRMYLANDDTELRAANAEALGLPYEEAKCEGCRNAGGTIAFLEDTEPCDVFRCAAEKGVAFCYQCSDFPCDHLHPYADQASVRQHNTKLFNLCLIKKDGPGAMGENQGKECEGNLFQRQAQSTFRGKDRERRKLNRLRDDDGLNFYSHSHLTTR